MTKPDDYDISIHQSADARRWAAEFIKAWKKVYPDRLPPDEEWMFSWFANAMMAQHDHDIPFGETTAADLIDEDGKDVV